MTANLIMRLVWVLSISPDVISRNIRPELFALIVGFVEIFRRSVWNFLRVEKEHTANVGNFKAVPDMKLPIPEISYDTNLREEDIFSQDLKIIIENDNKLGKPISNSDYNYHKASIVRKGSFHLENNADSNKTFKFIPEGEEYVMLKMLSKITSEPISSMKNRDKELLNYDIMKYRKESPQLEIWAKEIKQFRQHMAEKANQFQVVPNYKELKLFSLKSRNYDSPHLSEDPTKRFMKKTISNRNFTELHTEEVPEEDELNKLGSRKTFDDMSELENGSYKKLSFGGREANLQIPLMYEMKKLSVDKDPRTPHSQFHSYEKMNHL